MDWIDTTKKLPDEDTNYLVWSLTNGEVTIAGYSLETEPDESPWRRLIDDEHIKVSHWMSLPDKPKGVK